MPLARWIRILSPYVIAALAPWAIHRFGLVSTGLAHYNDIMSATINLGAIGVGFLAASITLLPSIGNNKFIQKLKEIGAYKKLLKGLVHAIVLLFLLSVFSVIGVFIGNAQYKFSILHHVITIATGMMYVWSYLFTVVVIVCGLVMKLFLRVLFLSADDA